jgi:type IV secretory pathway TraG/TraD family ATPase VirD4
MALDRSSEWYHCPGYWISEREMPARPPRVRQGIFGNGRLASARDLGPLLARPRPGDHALVLPEATLLVEAGDNGGQLEALLHRDLVLPQDLRDRHVLAVGTTGSGKTQKLILPQLAADLRDPERTIIALDAKGGVLFPFLQALARRYRPGQVVHQVNFKQPARNTIIWNPTTRIRTRADALEVAHAVCTNSDLDASAERTGSHHDKFWIHSSVNLLSDLLLVLARSAKEAKSMARAKQLLDGYSYDLAVFADAHKVKTTEYPAICRALEGSSHVTQQSVVADLAQRMILFGDENVVACTCRPNELDLAQLIRGGGILVLEVPEAHAGQLLPLTSLFITELFQVLLGEAQAAPDGRLPRPVSVTLDELGSACGRLPEFDRRLSTLRSRGVSVTGAVQTLGQLESLYGKSASAIAEGFCTKIFFGGGLGHADARFASELSGVCTVENVTVTETEEVGEDTLRVSRTRTPTPRPVLLPEEVCRPPVSTLLGSPVTVFTPALPPFQAYLTPAYQTPDLARALESGQPRKPASSGADPTARQIRASKQRLGWRELAGPVRTWWRQHEKKHRRRRGRFLELLRRLEALAPLYRRLSAAAAPGLLTELYHVHRATGATRLATTLDYLRYHLRRGQEEEKRKTGEDEGADKAIR